MKNNNDLFFDHTEMPVTAKIVLILVFVIVIGLAIWYAIWQYNLCYPKVSDGVWYCLRHAGIF
jgi:hypothetical protein